MVEKLPDDYVENKLSKEYPTEIGSQFFKPYNIEAFKKIKVKNVKDYYSSRLLKLEEEYNNIMDEIYLNKRIYSARYNFKPVIGNVYHLYEGINGSEFLSIIGPNEWNFKYLGSYRFLYDGRWEKYKLNGY